jgi:hypothetical protein
MELNLRLHNSDAPVSGTYLVKGRVGFKDALKDVRGTSFAPSSRCIPVLRYLIDIFINHNWFDTLWQ